MKYKIGDMFAHSDDSGVIFIVMYCDFDEGYAGGQFYLTIESSPYLNNRLVIASVIYLDSHKRIYET